MSLRAIDSPAKSVRDQVSAAEWKAREELALAHRLLFQQGADDLTYNHLSMRVPGEPDALLVKPGDECFDEVTASSLLKFGVDGQPRQGTDKPLKGGALIIHAGILRARPDIAVVFHTHTPALVGVSNQKQGLLPISQHALPFHKRIAYHAFGGLEFNPGMEKPLLKDLGTHKVALLHNHGALIVADSVAEAVVTHHFLEWACRIQIASLAGGSDVIMPPREVCDFAAQQYGEVDAFKNGGKNWPAMVRRGERLFPDYKD